MPGLENYNGRYCESQYEYAFIGFLENEGWQYLCGNNVSRITKRDVLIEEDFKTFISKTNPDLTDNEVTQIYDSVRLVGAESDFATLHKVYGWMVDGIQFTPENGVAKMVPLIDFDVPENNVFKVVNQLVVEYTNHGQKSTRRPDVLLYVNGMPLCVIELKNPADVNATVYNAWEQINIRYWRDIPHLLRYCPLACISDGVKTRLGTVRTPYEHFYAWRRVNDGDKISTLPFAETETMIKGVYSPKRFLEIFRDYIYFQDTIYNSDEVEIVCRYPQFFASRLLKQSIIDSVVSKSGKGGTYFGATGCGKTYTMAFLARQLALRCTDIPEIGSPTIILIVDRDELQKQGAKLFTKSTEFLNLGEVSIVKDRAQLRQELGLRQSGGFYICTIQKFCDRKEDKIGLINDRQNIICFSDEAHRTQIEHSKKIQFSKDADENMKAMVSKPYAKVLKEAFPQATFVGFTGTPIAETYQTFGDEIDRYTMDQSVADGLTVSIKYHPRIAKVLLDKEKVKEIEEYYKKCADDGATKEDVEASKKAMSSMEMIIGEPSRLERLAVDIHDHYISSCATNPDRIQKAMIVCSNRKIAYSLLKKFKEKYPEWFVEKKALDGIAVTEKELNKLKPMPFMAMVASVGSNDEPEMYDYLGGVKNDKRSEELDLAFKQEKSNFQIVIVVDMWITGFDVPCLTMLYNDKPLSKHTLIQTISRVNRKFGTKECGFIIDYIGIREEMKKAMKKYGGEVGPQEDLEIAHEVLQNELQLLQERLSGLVFDRFFGNNDLARLQFIQEAAEYILANSVERKGEVSFLKLFKEHAKRLRSAYNICNPAGILTEGEVTWSQCFMGICSYVNKMTTTEHDTENMNRHVEQMVQEAILASGVERVMNEGVEENIFSDSFAKEVDEIKMPFTKFQILCKLVAKAIRAYSRTNKIQAEHFQKMLENTIDAYNTRDKLTFTNEVTQNVVNDVCDIVSYKINGLSNKLMSILKELKADSEKFKVLGITFEEKAFFDVLVEVRDKHGFEYADERCIELAKKIKTLIDDTAVYADWLNNDNLKSKLASQLTYLLYKEGYPPQWDEEVFQKVLEQVENYKKHE